MHVADLRGFPAPITDNGDRRLRGARRHLEDSMFRRVSRVAPDRHRSSHIELGFTWRAFALALIGGMLITVMTHLQHSTRSDGVRLVPATVMGFLLGAGQINHAIVASLVCFAALHVGAPFGYLDWLGLFGLAVLGNMIGGLTLVTLFRLLQVPNKVMDELRENEPDAQR